MSRFILANSKNVYENYCNLMKDSIFEKYTEYISAEENMYIRVYKKMNVDNYNFLRKDNHFIACTGTLIYDNKIGESALQSIMDDYHGDIFEIREKCHGSFCLMIKYNNKMQICCDKSEIYNVYYYLDGQEVVISNYYYYMAKSIKDRIEVNEFALLEKVFQNCNIDNHTIFNNIYRLAGDESIKIKNSIEILTTCDFEQGIVFGKSEEEWLDIIVDKIKKAAERTKLFTDSISITMTGGLDSRLQLASLMSVGIKPTLITGCGYRSKNNDYIISQRIAQKYNLPLIEMNWNNSIKISGEWQTLLPRFGENYLVNSGTSEFFNGFRSKDYYMMLFGYYGEVLRNKDWLEDYEGEYFTIEEYLDEFYINPEIKKICLNYEKYHDILRGKFDEIVEEEGLNPCQINKTNFKRINIRYRKHADNVMNNLINDYCYSYAFLTDNDLLLTLINIPYEYKVNSRFMLRLIEKLYPDLLNFDFFTHLTKKKYDYKKSILKNDEEIARKIQKALLKKLSRETNIYRCLNLIYQYIFGKNKKAITQQKKFRKELMFEVLDKSMTDFKFVNKQEIKNISEQKLFVLSQYIYMIDNIFSSNEHDETTSEFC